MVTSVYLPVKDIQFTPITVSEGCGGLARALRKTGHSLAQPNARCGVCPPGIK